MTLGVNVCSALAPRTSLNTGAKCRRSAAVCVSLGLYFGPQPLICLGVRGDLNTVAVAVIIARLTIIVCCSHSRMCSEAAAFIERRGTGCWSSDCWGGEEFPVAPQGPALFLWNFKLAVAFVTVWQMGRKWLLVIYLVQEKAFRIDFTHFWVHI